MSDHRIDPHVEADLRWRWHFAEGEIMRIPSHAQAIERRMKNEPIVQGRALIRTAAADPVTGRGGGGVTVDVGLRCGPIAISAQAAPFSPDTDIDWRSVEAAARSRRIDAKLRALDEETRGVLWLGIGARPRVGLLQFGPLCNLTALTSAAIDAHRRARSTRPLVEWLERLSGKAAARRLKVDEWRLVTAMQREAERLLGEAGRAYGAAWG